MRTSLTGCRHYCSRHRTLPYLSYSRYPGKVVPARLDCFRHQASDIRHAKSTLACYCMGNFAGMKWKRGL